MSELGLGVTRTRVHERRGDWLEKNDLELYELNLFFLKTGFHKGSSVRREAYLDFPDGCLSVDGDGGIPTSPPRGSAAQGGQCGCGQAGQAARPLECCKDQT